MNPEDEVQLDLSTTSPTNQQGADTATSDTPCPPDADEEGSHGPDDELMAGMRSPILTTLCVQPSESDLEVPQTSSAIKHYQNLMSLCCCSPSCPSDYLKDLAKHFSTFNEAERIRFMRKVLFAISATEGTSNDFMAFSGSEKRKKRRRESQESLGRTTDAYGINGKRLCRPAFAAVMQLSEKQYSDMPLPFVRHQGQRFTRKGVMSLRKVKKGFKKWGYTRF